MSFPKIISIEGNIGAGKTTLINNLENYINSLLKEGDNSILFIREPVDVWETIKDINGTTILEKFYGNPEKYAFSFQVMAYATRTAKLAQIIRENPDCKYVICERSLEADNNVFAKMLKDDNKIEDIEYQIYEYFYETRKQDMNLDAIIYADVSPNVCLERICKRSRDGESGIKIDYLQKCNDYHNEWITRAEKVNQPKVLRIDANDNTKYDINDETDSGYKWMRIIHNFIKEL
tara:strand:+ start:9250 stop:9951 length:702 start_codon:yes stop_codon:yes gene_type:complete